MGRLYLFADEAGDFAFTRGDNVPRYFILGTVVLESCDIGTELLALRRDMAWRKMPLGDYFHASTDKQSVRNEVFELLKSAKFQIHATIMEKSKAQPQVRESRERFYKYGWLYHFRHSQKHYLTAGEELHITAASVGTKKGQGAFTDAVNDVVQQTIGRRQWATSFWPSASDPCLQVADYCIWAIQRKWEREDARSYALIRDKVVHEYDMWAHGGKHYY
ncbi:DUF3800 domain-containing protein [Caulobacter mirabilis]|uniref:DUF3800 domain-containing protein n=1 Tax=Caulobacter mirabilis TaxID=69666 RepID=A0A2D2AWE2_9CAUL|nr:DUF3800 domain-containing protein [Caulobacter mirabilis]ATQ42332.1 hypothetical protein CSW64_07845 [Caulobacter mirabilis]